MPSEIIPLSRDVKVTEIPSGVVHILGAGTPVYITQSLGGSYTISNGYGQLLRVDARDADALGFEVAAEYMAVESPNEFSEDLVWSELKTVYDPEIPVNIVDLGLIYRCDITEIDDGKKIDIDMTMTAPGCGMGDVLKADVENKLSPLPGVKEVTVNIVFDPPWGVERMSEATRLQLGIDY
jgi:probable FeS assembly SUF system protein SufT